MRPATDEVELFFRNIHKKLANSTLKRKIFPPAKENRCEYSRAGKDYRYEIKFKENDGQLFLFFDPGQNLLSFVFNSDEGIVSPVERVALENSLTENFPQFITQFDIIEDDICTLIVSPLPFFCDYLKGKPDYGSLESIKKRFFTDCKKGFLAIEEFYNTVKSLDGVPYIESLDGLLLTFCTQLCVAVKNAVYFDVKGTPPPEDTHTVEENFYMDEAVSYSLPLVDDMWLFSITWFFEDTLCIEFTGSRFNLTQAACKPLLKKICSESIESNDKEDCPQWEFEGSGKNGNFTISKCIYFPLELIRSKTPRDYLEPTNDLYQTFKEALGALRKLADQKPPSIWKRLTKKIKLQTEV